MYSRQLIIDYLLLIKSINGVEEAKLIPGVENIFFRCKVGDVVLPYTDSAKRVCFIIVIGKNEKEARQILDKAISKIAITTV